MYADLAVQGKHIARDGATGCEYSNLNHWVYAWHVNKFGLKSIAEINLVDLIVTVRAHAAESHKVEMFGAALGILPGVEQASLEHLDHYLACVKALAGGKPVQTLFTEDDDVWVPAVRVGRCKKECVEAAAHSARPDPSSSLQPVTPSP